MTLTIPMIPAPDGYQYGVQFTDGSVAARWNGRTQRQRAIEYRDRINSEYAPDRHLLVRRRPGGEWKPACRCGGSGWIYDRTWCGDDDCCPVWLNCLACNERR